MRTLKLSKKGMNEAVAALREWVADVAEYSDAEIVDALAVADALLASDALVTCSVTAQQAGVLVLAIEAFGDDDTATYNKLADFAQGE